MKYVALAAVASLGVVGAIAPPASAANFSWDIEYTGWWDAEGGGSVMGSIIADESAAGDGLISADELLGWSWDWTGNSFVSPFSISSEDAGAEVQFFDGFYLDPTLNQPESGLDQGTFIGGDFGQYAIDFEFLSVADDTTAFPFGGDVTFGDATAASGRVAVSDPTKVPEPATLLGLLALAGAGLTLKGRQQAA
jgi:hypothetical protein